MTIDLLIKQFEAEYLFECQRRNIKHLSIPTKLYATFFSEGQQELLNLCNPLTRTADISVVAKTSEYSLPADFGQLVSAKVSNIELETFNIEDTPTTLDESSSGEYQKIAIYFPGNATGTDTNYHKLKLLYTPLTAFTLTIWYKPNLNYFIAGGDVAQQWGSYTASSSAFSGDLKVPDVYAQPLKYFLMYKALGEFGYYEKFKVLIKEISKGMNKLQFENEYRLGGID